MDKADRSKLLEVTMSESGKQEGYVSLLSGSGIVVIGLAIHLVITMVTEALVARHLGPVEYGLISWSVMLLNVLSMISGLGLNTAARRFVPIFVQQADWASLRGSLILTSLLTAGGGVVGCAAFLVGAESLSFAIFDNARLSQILTILAFAVPFWSLQKIFIGLAAGFKYPGVKVVMDDLVVPMGLLGVVTVAIVFDLRELGITVGYAFVYVISAVVSGITIAKRTAWVWFAPIVPRYHVRRILDFSWPLIFTEPLVKCTGLIDILIVGGFASAQDVGTYRVASDLAVIISFVLMCFSFMYLPVISGFVGAQDRVQWGEMNARVAHWSMLLSFPIFAVLFFFPEHVISIVYGSQYGQAASVLRILAVAYFGHTIVGFTAVNLVAAGLTRIHFVILWGSLAINIVTCSLLIPRLGIVGAAIGSLLSLWALNGLSLLVMYWRLGIHPFKISYGLNLAALLVIGTMGWYLLRMREFAPEGVALGLFILFCLASMIVLFRLGALIDVADRHLIQTVVADLVSRFRSREQTYHA
ncbi:MAG: flippase [Candidatus Binatia bacterium]